MNLPSLPPAPDLALGLIKQGGKIDAMRVQPNYQLRARFCGVMDWLCPWCGHMNRSRINRTAWRLQCKAKPCRRQFAIGAIFHSMAGLQRSGRPYLPPPDVTFPLAELDSWQPGGPVNRLVLESEDVMEESKA